MDAAKIDSENLERSRRILRVGNLHSDVTENILYDLFTQIGPVECVQYILDKHGLRTNFALVTFKYQCSVRESMVVFGDAQLYGSPIKMSVLHKRTWGS